MRHARWIVALVLLLLLAAPPAQTQAQPPLTLEQVRALISVAPDARIAEEITNRGLAFVPAKETLSDLRKAGAGGKTLDAVESYIPLLDEARKQIPPLLDTLFKGLDAGNHSALTPLAFKELLDDSRRLDTICAPFSYQAHYLDAVTEPQRRVFHALVHVLTKDSREYVTLLEFAPVGEKFLLRNVLAPAEVFRRDAVQQAVDVARQLLYAVCARRFDLLPQFATPGLLRSIEFARFGDDHGWPLFTDCSYAQVVTEQVEAVNYSGLKLKTTLRPSGRYNLSLLLDQVDGAWKVVRIEKPTYPPTAAEDPEIRSYVLKRFRVGAAPAASAVSAAPPAENSSATWRPLLDSAVAALERGDFPGALQLAERALAAGATGWQAFSVAGSSAFMTGDFERAADYSARALQGSGKVVFPVRHRHFVLFGAHPMALGRIVLTSQGIAFDATECPHGFTEQAFATVTTAALENGFLLHLEIGQGKGKKKNLDFGDVATGYVLQQNRAALQYRPGREDAVRTILRIIESARGPHL